MKNRKHIKTFEEKKSELNISDVRLSLPSFAEIKEAAEQEAETSFNSSEVEKRVAMHNGFIEGANWMQDRILGNEA